MPAAELFATRLDTHARERPEAVALIDRDRPVTHAALRAACWTWPAAWRRWACAAASASRCGCPIARTG